VTSPAYPAVFEGYEAKREELRAWLRKYYVRGFSLSPPCRILDAGCGEGFWAELFREEGFDVVGVDLEPAYVAEGRRKYPELDLRVADIEGELPFPRIPIGSFDVVFVRAVSHLYAPSLRGAVLALGNLRDYLVPGGLLLLSAYTDGSGEAKKGAFGDYYLWHHAPAAIQIAVEEAGYTVDAVTRSGKYLHIGARR